MQRVLIVGAGFAGDNAARELSALAGRIEIVVISGFPADLGRHFHSGGST